LSKVFRSTVLHPVSESYRHRAVGIAVRKCKGGCCSKMQASSEQRRRPSHARRAEQHAKESDQQRRAMLSGRIRRGGGFDRGTKIPSAVSSGTLSAIEGSDADSVAGKKLGAGRSVLTPSTVSVQVSDDCTAGPGKSGRCLAQQRSPIGSTAMCFPGSTHNT
jgi:hypothetical protein